MNRENRSETEYLNLWRRILNDDKSISNVTRECNRNAMQSNQDVIKCNAKMKSCKTIVGLPNAKQFCVEYNEVV